MKKYETYIYIVKNLDGGNHMNLIVLAPVGATVALLFAAYFTYTIFKVDEGTDSMKHIAESIRKGANAYLKRQYIAVGKFFVVIFICPFSFIKLTFWFVGGTFVSCLYSF